MSCFLCYDYVVITFALLDIDGGWFLTLLLIEKEKGLSFFQ